jgi:hypothetical protein
MECIRRVNLDAVWGRERATVESTVRSVRKTVSLLRQVGVDPPYPALEPHPVEDNMGYALAIAMVLKSREPGKYAEYQQFETIRKLRAGFSNVYMVSKTGVQSLRSVGQSFRRGATSEARARGVRAEDVGLANRWHNFESAKGHRPQLAMRDHYSDIRLLIPALLKFSEGL